MIIGENSNNSFAFSIFTNKELEEQDCIKQINFVLEKYNILENVQKNSNYLREKLEKRVLNYRSCGYLIAFDFLNYVSEINRKSKKKLIKLKYFSAITSKYLELSSL